MEGRGYTGGMDLHAWRRGRNLRLITQGLQIGGSKSGGSGSSVAGGSAGAGLGILVLIGILFAVFHHDSKQPQNLMTEPSPADSQPSAAPAGGYNPAYSNLSGNQDPPSEPSNSLDANGPGVAADSGSPPAATPPDSSYTASAAADLPQAQPASPQSSRPVTLLATHKEGLGGGCRGELTLSDAGLHFACPGQSDLDFPAASIARPDGDGVELTNGQKYHFKIDGMKKDDVGNAFNDWFARVLSFKPMAGAPQTN